MARYKFSWDNLPPGLLRGLKRELPLEGDAPTALRKAYGARPSVDFVQETWAVLLQSWLTKDRESRVRIVEELRTRRLGDRSIEPRNSSDQIEYLRSCRNSAALRDVVIEVLITVGDRINPMNRLHEGSLESSSGSAPKRQDVESR